MEIAGGKGKMISGDEPSVDATRAASLSAVADNSVRAGERDQSPEEPDHDHFSRKKMRSLQERCPPGD